ncbi:uncharacterized protein [Arachis hypogaea]|uniref:uncharacterized protein n=1 Tax=Arachis hypogaea TaxID=3818 RepID=UPI000DECCE18|nr:uncharacterized protein LOC112720883 [Arachis hypogaea]
MDGDSTSSGNSVSSFSPIDVQTLANLVNHINILQSHNRTAMNPSLDPTSPYFLHPGESPEIAQSVLWIDSAMELWKELQHRYQRGDIFRIAELEEELFTVKQGDLSITGYYTKLKRIWEELDNYRPIPQCSHCRGRCNCEYSVVKGYKEDSCVVRLLRGLNEQFSTARSQLMMTKPLPGIDEAFSLLLQQERQLNAVRW